MLAHRGLQHLGRQVEEVRADVAHQHHGPFDQTRDLGQQALVLDHLQTLREGLVVGLDPDVIGAFVGAQQHLGALQLCLVILEGR